MNMYEGTVDVDKLLKDLEKVFLKYWAGYVPKEYEKEIEISEE
jgi:RNA ligase